MDYQSCTKNKAGSNSLTGALVSGSSYQQPRRLER